MRRSQWKACRPAFLDGDVTRGARLSMESVHVIAGLDPTDGGPAYSVPSLCAALGRAGWTAPILTVRSERCNDRPGLRTFPQIAAKIPVLGALRLAPELRRASFEMARHMRLGAAGWPAALLALASVPGLDNFVVGGVTSWVR